MSDPRLFVVKQCPPAYAANSGSQIGGATSARNDFFSSIGKIGDLQVLNDIGGGKVGSGLRTLASISNSIRSGTGALPTSISSSLEIGANWVLETTGIPASSVTAVQNFHPAIANQAYGQAKNIFQQVHSGSFKMTDIPFYMQDLQNLSQLGSSIFTPSSNDAQSSLTDRCEASPYAVDLIARAPKFKFLFVVQFVPEDGYSALSGSDFGPLDMAFTVKKSTRPNVRFQMEDVNYYNFRTKVITKTEFEEMTMSFHDDSLNLATEFYRSYLRAMSPITGLSPNQSALFEQGGMNFVGNTLKANEILSAIPANTYAASHGPLANDKKQVFKEIILYHIFDFGKRMNVYRFIHPRINQLVLDDVDMSAGTEGNELTLTFNYDSVYVDADVSMANNNGKYNLAQTQRGAVYPLRNSTGQQVNAAGSILNPYGVNDIPTFDGGSGINPIDTRSSILGSNNAVSDAFQAVQSLDPTQIASSFTSQATSSFSSLTSIETSGASFTSDQVISATQDGVAQVQTAFTSVMGGAAVAADPELAAKYSGNPSFTDSSADPNFDTGSVV